MVCNSGRVIIESPMFFIFEIENRKYYRKSRKLVARKGRFVVIFSRNKWV